MNYRSVILPIVVLFSALACATIAGSSDLNQSVDQTARSIVSSLQTGPADIALVPPVSTESEEPGRFGEYFAERLLSALSAATPNYSFIERRLIDQILQEQSLNYSGTMNAERSANLQALIPARYLISGTYTVLAETVEVNVRVVDIRGGRILAATAVAVAIDADVEILLQRERVASETTAASSTPRQAVQESSGTSREVERGYPLISGQLELVPGETDRDYLLRVILGEPSPSGDAGQIVVLSKVLGRRMDPLVVDVQPAQTVYEFPFSLGSGTWEFDPDNFLRMDFEGQILIDTDGNRLPSVSELGWDFRGIDLVEILNRPLLGDPMISGSRFAEASDGLDYDVNRTSEGVPSLVVRTSRIPDDPSRFRLRIQFDRAIAADSGSGLTVRPFIGGESLTGVSSRLTGQRVYTVDLQFMRYGEPLSSREWSLDTPVTITFTVDENGNGHPNGDELAWVVFGTTLRTMIDAVDVEAQRIGPDSPYHSP